MIRAIDLVKGEMNGHERLLNPHYEFRKMFHRIYDRFKPDYVWWALVILARKFMLAFATLMFRKNPSFQMSVMLTIMFISYVIQVIVN